MYRLLITAAMLMVFGATSFMSISGLVSVFASAPVLIIITGAGIELGKIMFVVHLHRNWKMMVFMGRCFYVGVALVLVLLTSAEVLGYLSLNHTMATAGTEATLAADEALAGEAALLAGQITVIDETLAGLPAGYVSKRLSVRKSAGYDEKQTRLLTIMRERAALGQQVHTQAESAGPVYAVAKIFGIDPEAVAFFFILVLVGILEPLSVGLTVAVSDAWEKKEETVTTNYVAEQEPVVIETQPEIVAEIEQPEPVKVVAAADEPEESVSPNYDLLIRIQRQFNFTARQIAEITKRKKVETVEEWLKKDGQEIPEKALRMLARYVQGKPKLMAVG